MTTKEEKNTPGEGTPPSPLHSHGGHKQNQGNTADEAQAGNTIAANPGTSPPGEPPPPGTQWNPMPSGTQGSNFSESNQGGSMPTSTGVGSISSNLGGTFPGASLGTSSNAGAAPVAPAPTQTDPSDFSESKGNIADEAQAGYSVTANISGEESREAP